MIDLAVLPAINATLNGVAFVLLLVGYANIRRRNVTGHKAFMISALAASALFLTSYLIYHFNHPVTPFGGEGVARVVYFLILVPHIILAAAMAPMVLIVVWRAARGDFVRHKRLARWTLPIWLYVSVTGVLVYLMLYQWFPAGAAS